MSRGVPRARRESLKPDEGRIFSGGHSKTMWKYINEAKTVADLKFALYVVCCRIQELEAKLSQAGQAKEER